MSFNNIIGNDNIKSILNRSLKYNTIVHSYMFIGKQGIGKKLYYKVESLNNNGFFTVNSSLYAHEVYKHLGFIDTDKEQSIKGLRFYPMKKNLK